ncbi:DUF6612 family protein [Saccharomonospora azurea]|uniref:Lipoprotein n=1 Tax=Saccharomonospora azurea NA-128 TaxID=882081 RepID=H8GCA5_9PSEU|nr:DUF6612 family protein [Saccharomonospora azurea]EHY88739.1 hypothetical protein SacazDRAFT_01821 [Saccharomonospora azurea NA-128]
MRKLALAAGGMAVALALTACGGDGDDTNGLSVGGGGGTFGDLQQLVASVEDKAEQVQSVKFDAEMTMLGMQFTMTGQTRIDPDDIAMSMTMSMAGGEQEMRIVDETIYMKVPELGEPGKSWVKRDLSEEFAELENDGTAATLLENSDPRKTLEQFQEAGGTITSSEATTLDGRPVTRYTLEIDAVEMAKASGEIPAEMMPMMESLGTIPALVYLNSDALPVRMEVEMDMSAMLEEAAEVSGEEIPAELRDNPDMLTMSISQDYYDWGEPVTIEAPPADQVSSKPLEDF